MERTKRLRGKVFGRQRLGLSLVIAAALIALLTAPLALAAPTTQDDAVLRVGYLGEAGDDGANGARLAISQINAAGGITAPDGTVYRLELVMPPAALVALNTLEEAVEDLAGQDVIAILGPNVNARFDETTVAALADTRLPILTAATENALMNGDLAGQLFRLRAPEPVYSEALASYLLEEEGIESFVLVQGDIESTEPLVSFQAFLRQFDVEPEAQLQIPDDEAIIELSDINPEAVVVWGPDRYAVSVLRQLRDAGWTGQYAYRLAEEAARADTLPDDLAGGVIGVTSWSYAYPSRASRIFLQDYTLAFGEVPGPIGVAMYDAVWLLRAVIASQGPEPDDLLAGLTSGPPRNLVQGTFTPGGFENGDLIHVAQIYRLTDGGGSTVLARYVNGQLAPLDEEEPVVLPTPPAGAAATPPAVAGEGAYAVVTATALNVRAGSDFTFERIGEVRQGDVLEILGALADYSWLLINYQGGLGWVNAEFTNITGDLSTVSVIEPLPTPTVAVTLPPAQGGQPDLLIEGVTLDPAQPASGQPFTATVTVRNVGGGAAGRFAVGMAFEPAQNITSFIEGLASGQATTVQMTSTLVTNTPGSTGTAQLTVTADLNNEVAESNETNNTYTVQIQSTVPALATQSNVQLNAGTQSDLYGGTVDFTWDGYNIEMENGARMGVLSVPYEMAGPGDLSPATINNTVGIGSNQVQPGVVLGMITAEGNPAVMRIENRQDQTIWISYRVFGQ